VTAGSTGRTIYSRCIQHITWWRQLTQLFSEHHTSHSWHDCFKKKEAKRRQLYKSNRYFFIKRSNILIQSGLLKKKEILIYRAMGSGLQLFFGCFYAIFFSYIYHIYLMSLSRIPMTLNIVFILHSILRGHNCTIHIPYIVKIGRKIQQGSETCGLHRLLRNFITVQLHSSPIRRPEGSQGITRGPEHATFSRCSSQAPVTGENPTAQHTSRGEKSRGRQIGRADEEDGDTPIYERTERAAMARRFRNKTIPTLLATA
jgi:hypothetical protein